MKYFTNYAFSDNNSPYQGFLYHKNHFQNIPTSRKYQNPRELANQLVSPGGQHIAATRCIAGNLENSFGGMSRLVGLQRRQAVETQQNSTQTLKCTF